MSLESIRRRREEKLRRLREETNREPLYFDDEDEADFTVGSEQSATLSRNKKQSFWDDELWDEDEQIPDKTHSTFLLKLMLSVFIVSGSYVIYHTDSPISDRGKQFIGEVMTREFNFQGVVAEVEQRFGINPAIIPVNWPQSSSSQEVWRQTARQGEFLSPLKGEITSTFATDGTGIQIMAEDETVQAVDEGVVIFSGQKEDGGNKITILHKSGTKSTYIGMDAIHVSTEDWVQPGQAIASMKPGSTLRFSMQLKDEYVDPMSVITFE